MLRSDALHRLIEEGQSSRRQVEENRRNRNCKRRMDTRYMAEECGLFCGAYMTLMKSTLL